MIISEIKKISKNYYQGQKLDNIEDILKLANEGKSIVWEVPGKYERIVPAAFVQNWPLRKVANDNFYVAISEDEKLRIVNYFGGILSIT